ncbi:hypothetical protein [Bacillus cereus]|uniref:Abortive phage infection protein C-terminal domain-containing protein n=1 Tax=Bacillus cereus TaxID=1396 RepID=A0A9X6VKY8_BACCE|nr:hypothetical protein [Bacillus cereus]PFB23621.1 hypothetical protein CN388_27375 [Bacillus cereus]PFC10970.1 hypothetical protein CN284_19570 [Bacillus cereus]PFD21558.1 hypothetical protein CN263_14840 [Bacillus cereus]
MKKVKETIVVRAKFMRRLPDPIDSGKQHYLFWLSSNDLPDAFPTNPNPRPANIELLTYREVADSFLNQNGATPYTFHLKNKGLDIVAQYVKQLEKADHYEIGFNDNEGLANGHHTFKIMKKHAKKNNEQFVFVKVTTNVPADFIPEMANGLNTSVQVHLESILNKKGAFDWIKEVVADETYANEISYVENERKAVNVLELISILTIFNIDLHEGIEKHPKYTYSARAKCLKLYEDYTDSYKQLTPILKDILILHDTIKEQGPVVHREQGGKNTIGYIETRERTPVQLIFINKKSSEFLSKGALFPILAAFRWFITKDEKTGLYKWKNKGGFMDIIAIWDEHGKHLMNAIKDSYNAVGKDPNALGKNNVTWSSAYSELLSAFLSKQQF